MKSKYLGKYLGPDENYPRNVRPGHCESVTLTGNGGMATLTERAGENCYAAVDAPSGSQLTKSRLQTPGNGCCRRRLRPRLVPSLISVKRFGWVSLVRSGPGSTRPAGRLLVTLIPLLLNTLSCHDTEIYYSNTSNILIKIIRRTKQNAKFTLLTIQRKKSEKSNYVKTYKHEIYHIIKL